jgi:hypothetical protein
LGKFCFPVSTKKIHKKFSDRPTAAVSVAAKFAAEIFVALSLVAATLFGYGDYGLPADWRIPAVNYHLFRTSPLTPNPAAGDFV